jgi:2-polyprenyl-6-methoxyphenol hydroxylase-like FAD-dependent oxidoreductase
MPDRSPHTLQHALVIGGSMAGLLAAKVLTAHAERVTIIERDRFPAEPIFRAGVPQGRHVHIFLARGQQVLERIFPGIGDEMRARDAFGMDLIADLQYYGAEGPVARFPSDLKVYLSSRALLETVVRAAVIEDEQIAVQEASEAVELIPEGGNAVGGVRVRKRAGAMPAPEEIVLADLVVDASGRDSKAPEWLEQLGYGRPREMQVNAFLGYASRFYRAPDAGQHDWKALLIPEQAPHLLRGGVIWPIEDHQWMVTLAGSGGDYPPTDEAGFLDFARTLSHPSLYEAIAEAEPLTPIYGYRRTENRMRQFERMPRWPRGYIVLGDAVCAFNPVYGQGMTVAALGAMALQRCLAQHGGYIVGIEQRFQRDLAKVNQTPWAMATGSDYLVPNVEGEKPGATLRFTHLYLEGVLHSLAEHVDIYVAFLRVAHLLDPPATLFRPSIAARVLRKLWQRRSSKRSSPMPAPAAGETRLDMEVPG